MALSWALLTCDNPDGHSGGDDDCYDLELTETRVDAKPLFEFLVNEEPGARLVMGQEFILVLPEIERKVEVVFVLATGRVLHSARGLSGKVDVQMFNMRPFGNRAGYPGCFNEWGGDCHHYVYHEERDGLRYAKQDEEEDALLGAAAAVLPWGLWAHTHGLLGVLFRQALRPALHLLSYPEGRSTHNCQTGREIIYNTGRKCQRTSIKEGESDGESDDEYDQFRNDVARESRAYALSVVGSDGPAWQTAAWWGEGVPDISEVLGLKASDASEAAAAAASEAGDDQSALTSLADLAAIEHVAGGGAVDLVPPHLVPVAVGALARRLRAAADLGALAADHERCAAAVPPDLEAALGAPASRALYAAVLERALQLVNGHPAARAASKPDLRAAVLDGGRLADVLAAASHAALAGEDGTRPPEKKRRCV